jgi:ribosome-binding protein aMBF1 (putative translation factor)
MGIFLEGDCLNKDEAFYRVIVRYITASSLDLSSVSALIGVDKKTIAKWMSGELTPHAYIRKPIEQILLEASLHSANNKST